MKKITLILGMILGVSLVALTAKDKEKDKGKSDVAAAPAQHVALTPADLKWGDVPPGLPAGAKMAVLEGDPTKAGDFTVRLQAPAGYKISPHTHPTAEHITVISGTMNFGMGDKFDQAAGKQLAAGGYICMPTGMKHYAWASDESIIQIHGQGPFQINYVNPDDDPRNTKR